jgi:hypothetical protein
VGNVGTVGCRNITEHSSRQRFPQHKDLNQDEDARNSEELRNVPDLWLPEIASAAASLFPKRIDARNLRLA